MPESIDPPDANSEDARSKLSEGLRTCRSVVANYRAMILGEDIPANSVGEGEPLEQSTLEQSTKVRRTEAGRIVGRREA